MASLLSASRRFEHLIRRADGVPFKGTIMPVDEGQGQATSFTSPRLVLRTTAKDVIAPRAVILDALGRRFLVAENGYGPAGYFSFRLFEVNEDLIWRRETMTKDELTGLDRGTAKEDLGTIPCMVEMLSETADGVIRISEERRRIITSALVKIGDTIDDAVVQRTTNVLGLTYAEIR